jgi:hypothetical protein
MLLTILTTLIAVAPAKATPAVREPLPTGECTTVRLLPFLPEDGAGEVPAGGRRFSATRTLALGLSARLRQGAAESRRVEFRLFTPRGHLYQTLRATTDAPQDPAATKKRPRRRPAWARATLPVAGTTIMVHTLYGTWRVEPHFEGEARPCGPPRRFKITR